MLINKFGPILKLFGTLMYNKNKPLMQNVVLMVLFVSLVPILTDMVLWKSVSVENGVQYVMIFGKTLMLK